MEPGWEVAVGESPPLFSRGGLNFFLFVTCMCPFTICIANPGNGKVIHEDGTCFALLSKISINEVIDDDNALSG